MNQVEQQETDLREIKEVMQKDIHDLYWYRYDLKKALESIDMHPRHRKSCKSKRDEYYDEWCEYCKDWN